MFWLTKVDSNEKPPKGAKRIASYVIPSETPGLPVELTHTIKGIYYEEDKKHTTTDSERLFTESDNTQLEFFPYFRDLKPENQNHRIMVVGKSGSGKSTIIGRILDQMCYDTAKPVIIISFVEVDPELDRMRGKNDQIKPSRLDLGNDEVMQLPVEFYKDSIVVFDDIEKGTNKSMVAFLLRLRGMMFEAGRHHGIDIISVSHDVLGGSVNKVVKAEATGIFMFPAFNQPHHISSYLKTYAGLKQDIVDQIMKLPSRWVYLNLNAPNYIISEKLVRLLH